MPTINQPPEVLEALQNGAHLILSVSGGKDSDVMSYVLHKWHQQQGFKGDLVMVHADLGRMERTETSEYVDKLALRVGVPLYIVRHSKYDLLEGFWQRYRTRPDAPPFSSAAARYCTSDWKRAPISKWIRNHYPSDATVICAMGLRAEESSARAKKPILRLRPDCQAKSKDRMVWDWNPILHWTEQEVWAGIKLNGNIYHPAYDDGNERLSCGCCVLACGGDIQNGAYNRPETFRSLVDLEIASGFEFQQNKPIWTVAPDLLTDKQKEILGVEL